MTVRRLKNLLAAVTSFILLFSIRTFDGSRKPSWNTISYTVQENKNAATLFSDLQTEHMRNNTE